MFGLRSFASKAFNVLDRQIIPIIRQIAGGGIVKERKRVVVVEVDGKEYRVLERDLPAFLDAVKVEAKASVKKSVKRARKQNKTEVVEEIFEQPLQVRVKSAPPDIIPKISAQVSQVNVAISDFFTRALEKHLQEIEDEEILLLSM